MWLRNEGKRNAKEGVRPHQIHQIHKVNSTQHFTLYTLAHYTDNTGEPYQYKSVMKSALSIYRNEIENIESDLLQSSTLKNIAECEKILDERRSW